MTDTPPGNLIGRDHPRTTLRAHIDRTLASHGGLVFVTGEAGIGKTSLVTEAAGTAEREGAVVAGGTCWERDGAPDYWPWVQVLRSLRRAVDPGDWAQAMAASGNEPAMLLGEGPDERLVTPGPDPGFGLHDAVTTLLVTVSRACPVVVVLDDLHWADTPSIRLLEFVARHGWFEQLLVVGTYRDVEVETIDHPLRALLVPLAAKATSVPLGGLSRDEVKALFTRTAGRQPNDAMVAEVHRRTGGNPFFVDQTAHLWQATNSIATVPPGIRDTVQRRLALLSGPLCDMLSRAAVLGPEFHRDVLAATVATDMSEQETDRLLGEAVQGRLVTYLGDGRWAFVHDLLREALYENLDPAEARRRHGAVTRALGDNPALVKLGNPGDRAHHAASAVPDVPAEEAAGLLRAAAQAAWSRLALHEAREHLRRAWELLPSDPTPDRVVLALELGESSSHLGDQTAERMLFLEAADLARQVGDPVLLARAALKLRGEVWIVHPEEMDRTATELIAEAHGRLLGQAEASTDAIERDNIQLEQELSARYVELVRDRGDDHALLDGLYASYDAHWFPGSTARRVAIADEIAAVAGRARDQGSEMFSAVLRLTALFEQGDPQWQDQLARILVTAEALNTAFSRSIGVWFSAMSATAAGRFGEARLLLKESERLDAEIRSDTTGPSDLGALRAQQHWQIELTQGRYEQARQQIQSALAHGHPHTELLEILTSLHIRDVTDAAGSIEHARHYLAKVYAGGERISRWLWPLQLRLEIEVATAESDPVARQRLRDELAPIRDEWAFILGDAAHGPISYWIARLDAADRSWDMAIDGFTAARDSADRIQVRPWSVEAGYRLAHALIERDDPGDMKAAAAMLDNVHRAATELEMEPIVARARRLRERADTAVHPTPDDQRHPAPAGPGHQAEPADDEANRFRFDGQVWELGYAGETVWVPEAKGLRDLHTLLGRPGRDVAAVDLMHPDGDPATRAAPRLGADPVLDEQAKTAYRRRLTQLDEEIEAALNRGRDDRAAQFDRERETLLDELRRATGLGGRPRRLGSQTERARKAVSERIRDTLRRLDRAHPELAEHLRASVATGSTCRYQPDPDDPPWQL